MNQRSEDYLREWFRDGPLPDEPGSLHDFLATVPIEHPRKARGRWAGLPIWPQRALAGLAAAVVVALVGGAIVLGLTNRSNSPIPGLSMRKPSPSRTSRADVVVEDSEAMSVLLAAQVRGAAGVLERGGTRAEAAAEAARIRGGQELLFTVPDLVALRAGGRIGAAAALLGGVLQVRPILTMRAGEVEVQARVRTNAKARQAIVDRLALRVGQKGKKARVIVAAADDEALADELEGKVREYADDIVRLEVGPVIAAHTGAGTGGIGYHFD